MLNTHITTNLSVWEDYDVVLADVVMDDVHETSEASVQHEEQVGLVDALELTDTDTINRTVYSQQRFYTILV